MARPKMNAAAARTITVSKISIITQPDSAFGKALSGAGQRVIPQSGERRDGLIEAGRFRSPLQNLLPELRGNVMDVREQIATRTDAPRVAD